MSNRLRLILRCEDFSVEALDTDDIVCFANMPTGRVAVVRGGAAEGLRTRVMVTARWALMLSAPHQLFEQRYAYGARVTIPNYDVSSDGQRFLMVKDDAGAGAG